MIKNFFAIRDSNDPEKDLANQVNDYVWNIWQKDNRIEDINKLFFASRSRFVLTPQTKDKDDLISDLYIKIARNSSLEHDDKALGLNISNLITELDSNEEIIIAAVDATPDCTDIELLGEIRALTINKDTGMLYDVNKKEYIEPTGKLLLTIIMGIFKMGDMPICAAILNSDFIENKCWDEFNNEETKFISVMKESRALKDALFSPAYRKGFVTQIGKHEMYVQGDEFQMEIFGEYLAEIPTIAKAIYENSLIYPYKNQSIDLENAISAYSNWPTTVDENGVVHVDMAKAEVGDTAFLRIEIEAGEFFKYWTFKNHRSIYEFTLHKIEDVKNQGTIHSLGFY